MRLASLRSGDRSIVGVLSGSTYLDVSGVDGSLGTDVGELLASGPDWRARVEAAVPRAEPVEAPCHRPVVPRPGKLLCLGLNDVDHAAEGGFEVPTYPAIFSRVASSLIGHGQAMLRPPESHTLDYEGELAVVIGTGGRRIAEADALAHVAGYTVFNDGTIREWQRKTAQWTIGKNWHGTGGLGPDLVTPEELPPGADGLAITTRIGDEVLQSGNTGKMIFKVAQTIALLSVAVALEPGDVIAFGTPAGVGYARTPPRWLVEGDVVEVSIENIGTLVNPVRNEAVA
jgi:acylpyruvate hydrolase